MTRAEGADLGRPVEARGWTPGFSEAMHGEGPGRQAEGERPGPAPGSSPLAPPAGHVFRCGGAARSILTSLFPYTQAGVGVKMDAPRTRAASGEPPVEWVTKSSLVSAAVFA
jgi:hypothetical protein